MTTLSTTLRCPGCGRRTEHQVWYAGTAIRSVRCLHCGRTLIAPPAETAHAWLRHWRARVASKPERVLVEARQHPLRFALGLPVRFATKPARLAAEVSTAVRAEAAARIEQLNRQSAGW